MTDTKGVRAFLGGSFNPPHLGHLAMASSVETALKTQTLAHQVALMPSHNPFKDKLPTKDRLVLLELALTAFNHQHSTTLGLETYELTLASYPTYTLDTFQALRVEYPDDSLIFVLGQDSFETLEGWKGGFELLNYCHLWVFARGDVPIDPKHSASLRQLTQNKAGHIFFDNTKVLDISSSKLRQEIGRLFGENANLDKFYQILCPYLTKTVIDYIFYHQLYQ